MTKWGHDELANDLAEAKRQRRMVWCDMQLGPSGSPRPDVYTIERSYSRPQPIAYEIKVSRSDFLADVTAGKYLSYFKYAQQIYFACPDGLLSRSEIPEGVGLIVRKDKVWRTVKRAVARPVTLPQDAMLKLIIDGVSRAYKGVHHRPRLATAYDIAKGDRADLADDVRLCVQDLAGARNRVKILNDQEQETRARIADMGGELRTLEAEARKRGERQSKRLMDEARTLLRSVWGACGLVGEPNAYFLRHETTSRAKEISEAAEVRRLREQLDLIKNALATAESTPVAILTKTEAV